MSTKGLVVVIAGAQGQGQIIAQAPLIFGKQCPGLLLEFRLGDAIGHFGFPPLAAYGGDVRFADRGNQLGVEDQVGGFQLAIVPADCPGYGGRRTDGAGNGPAKGFGGVVHQAGIQRAEAEAAGVGQGDLFALEAKLVVIAVRCGIRCGASPVQAVEGAELAFVVVVCLPSTLDIQREVMVLMRGQSQAGADVLVATIDGRGAALADINAIAVTQIRLLAIKQATADLQAEQAVDQRTTGVDTGVAGVAEVAILLVGVILCHRAGPLLADLAGDDVDYPAHGVGAVERRHRATDHFDALDGRQRRHEAGGGFVEAVWRDIACGVLSTAVDEDQGVLAGHAANADVEPAGLAGALADVDAFHVAQCLRQVVVALLLQVFTADDADAGRCFGDLLFEAGGADDRVVERDRRVLGESRPAAADHGAGQGGTCVGDRHAGS